MYQSRHLRSVLSKIHSLLTWIPFHSSSRHNWNDGNNKHYWNDVFPPTPQYNWPQLSESLGCEVWVKHENHTPTTAFKVRGGIVLIDALIKSTKPPKGLISATIGNHGQSLAFAGRRVGLAVTIMVPEGNNEDQNRAIKSHSANLIVHGHDFEAARQHSLKLQHDLEIYLGF